MTDTVCRIQGVAGPLVVRLVRPGERYGRDRCLVRGEEKDSHWPEESLVEFYDDRHHGDGFDPLGQFCSRYYAQTLWEDEDHLCSVGLNLDGRVDDWSVPADQMKLVYAWLFEEETK